MSNGVDIRLVVGFEEYNKIESKLKNLTDKLQKSTKLNIAIDQEAFIKIESQFNELKKKVNQEFKVNPKIKVDDVNKQLIEQLNKIKTSLESTGNTNVSLKTQKDAFGQIVSAMVKYTNEVGNVVKTNYKLGQSFKDVDTNGNYIAKLKEVITKDLTSTNSAMKKAITELESEKKRIEQLAKTKTNVSFITGEKGNIKSATISYSDETGKIIKQNYKLIESLKETENQMVKTFSWKNTSNNYSNNINKSIALLNNLEKQLNSIKNKNVKLEYSGGSTEFNSNYQGILKDINALKERGNGITDSEKRKLVEKIQLLNQENQKILDSIQNEKIKERVLIEEHNIRRKIITEQEKEKAKEIEIANYKEKMLIQLQNLQTKYGSLIKTSEIEKFKNTLNSLNSTNFNRNEIANMFARIESNAKASSKAVHTTQRDAMSLGGAFRQAFEKFPIWLLTGNLYMNVINFFRNGIRYSNELNKALTEISIVTGKNQEQVKSLAWEYSILAKQMAVTTKEIASAGVEFYRQGLTQSEVMERLKATTQYAKISSMDFKQSAETLTATVNSLGVDIGRATDVFSYLGDATATSAGEIGIAMSKVAGTSTIAGVSLEKMASWISTISSKTRESAETIGFSMQSILSRYMQIKEKGFSEEDGTQLNDVVKALSAVGITATDARGQLLPFADVMDAVGAKFKSLDKNSQGYLLTVMAGTRQSSRLANLLNDYGQSLKLNEGALNSAGATQQKYNLWMQGTEAHLNKLKTAGTDIWQTAFDSKGLQIGIDILAAIVSDLGDLTKLLGSVPMLIGGINLAIIGFSKSYRTFVSSMSVDGFKKLIGNTSLMQAYKYNLSLITLEHGKYNTVLMQSNPAIATIGMKFQALTSALKMTNLAMIATKISTIALQTVMTMGLALAISKTIEGLYNLANAQKNARQKSTNLIEDYKNSTQTANENLQKIKELIPEYNRLKNETNKTTEEVKKYNDIQKQIADMFPEMIKGYDSQGNVVIDLTKNYTELIEKSKEANKVVGLKSLNEAKDNKVFKTLISDTNNASAKLTLLNEKIKQIQEGYDSTIDNPLYGTSQKGIKEYEQSLLKLKEGTPEYENVRQSLERLKQELLNTQNQASIAQSELNDVSSQWKSWGNIILQTFDDFSNLNDNQKNFINNYLNNMDFSKFKNIDEFSDKLKQMTVVLKSNTEANGIVNSIFDLNKNLKDGTVSIDEYNNKINILLSKLASLLGVSPEELSKIFKLDSSNIKQAENSVDDLKKSAESLLNQMKNAKEVISDVNDILDKHTKSNEWDMESIIELAQKYPQLLEKLGDDKALTQELIKIKNSERDTVISGLKSKLIAQGDYINKITDGYEVDINNFKTAEEAKLQILGKSLTKQLFMHKQAAEEATKEIDSNPYAALGAMRAGDLYGMEYAKINSAIDTYYQLKRTYDGLNGYFDKVGSSEYDGKKDSSKKSKEPTKYTFDGKPLDMYEVKLQAINSQLENYDVIMNRIAKNTQKLQDIQSKDAYSQIIDLQIKKLGDLNSKQKVLESQRAELINKRNNGIIAELQRFTGNLKNKSVNDIARMNDEDWANLYNKMYGQDVFTGYDEAGQKKQKQYEENAQKFKQLIDNLKNYNKELHTNELAILDVENDINTAIKERIDWQEKLNELTSKDLADISGDIQDKLDLLEINDKTNYNEKIRLSQELLKAKQDELDFNTKARDSYSQQLKVLKEGTLEWSLIKEQVEVYNEKIDESTKNVQQLEKTLESINREKIDALASIEDEIVSALKNKYEKELELAKEAKAKELLLIKNLTDEQKKLLENGSITRLEIFEEEHEQILKLLNDELKTYEDIYNAKIKEIDRQEDKDSYDKDLNKKQQEKAKLQAQYDSLLMDSSLEAQSKRSDLLEQIGIKEDEINEFIHKRDIELRKQNLQDELESKKKAIQDKIDKENEAYKKAKDLYDREVKTLEDSNKEKLKSENLYAEARKMLMEGNFDALRLLLEQYGKDSERIFGSLGQTIKKEIVDNLQLAINLMKEFNGVSGDLSKWESRDKLATGESVMSKDDVVSKDKEYTINFNKELDESSMQNKIRVVNANGEEIPITTTLSSDKKSIKVVPKNSSYVEGQYQLVVDKGIKGITGNELNNSIIQNFTVGDAADAKSLLEKLIGKKFKVHEKGGLNTLTGWHWLDGTDTKPELILNAKETQAMIGLKDKLPPLLKAIQAPKINLPKFDLPNLSRLGNVPIELKIDRLINIEGNADRTVIPEIKQAGMNALTELRQALNKQGIRST